MVQSVRLGVTLDGLPSMEEAGSSWMTEAGPSGEGKGGPPKIDLTGPNEMEQGGPSTPVSPLQEAETPAGS